MLENDGPLILPLESCQKIAQVGGKAIGLANLMAGGFKVPGGFVVTSIAFQKAGGNEIPPDLAAEILAHYRSLGSPNVAVRSSATNEDLADASMAGQYETLLDISGEEELLKAVLQCWQSINTARTRAYLKDKEHPAGQATMAVVIQELVNADVAGVMFTEHPEGGADEILIEANWGLGETVVSGLTQPDTLVIDRATGEVRNFRLGEKHLSLIAGRGKQPVAPERREIPCLNSRDIENLRHLGVQISDHFGSPQDTEWAIRDGELYLLQARAITTIGDSKEKANLLKETRDFLESELENGRGEWVRHNLAETIPHPSKLTWSVIRRFMTGNGGFGKLYRDLGFQPSELVCEEGFLDLIGGRIYLDLGRAPEMFFKDFPFRYDLEVITKNPDAAQEPPTQPSGSALDRLRVAPRLAKVQQHLNDIAEDCDTRFTGEIAPAFEAWVSRELERDLTSLSKSEWVDIFHERERRVMDDFAPQSLLPGMIAGVSLNELRTFLAEHFWDESAEELTHELARAARPDRTVRSTEELQNLANGKLELKKWLADYGHRAPGEFDLATPRWAERPDELTAMASHLKDGVQSLELREARAASAEKKAEALAEQLDPASRREFRLRLGRVLRYLPFREDGKHHLMSGYRLIREIALEAGRRLEVGDDVFFLSKNELIAAMQTGFVPLRLIESRKARRSAESGLTLPSLIDEKAIAKLGMAPDQELTASDLENGHPAFPLSAGTASGPAAIVLRPEDAGDLGQGYILVCPSTDPNWTPLFVNASALILERGGTLSHGAIVAREMGLPAVVLENATSLFEDGETIQVDGHRGLIARGEETIKEAPESSLPPREIPPPPGRRERNSGTLRNLFLIFWTLYLAATFLLPAPWVKEPSLRLLDSLLLPFVIAIGRPGTVALIALALALVSLLGQKFLTDNGRLLVAKKRAAALRQKAAALPKDSPLRKQMLALARPVQARVMLASFVPLAIILGPMILSFIWFPLRLDPSSWNAEPGATVFVRAAIDGDYSGEISLKQDPSLELESYSPATQTIPQIRPVLQDLLLRWRTSEKLPPDTPWSILAAAEAAKAKTLKSLEDYLSRPIPDQTVAWTMQSSPDHGGRLPIELQAAEQTVTVPAVLGIGASPEPKTLSVDGRGMIQRTEFEDSPIRSVEVTYKQTLTREGQVFWKPVEFLVQPWLSGWLIVYLLVYLPSMILLRHVLRIA